MNLPLVEIFYNDIPSAICMKDSYIAAVNPACTQAKAGSFLFHHMSCESILKYQAHYESRAREIFFTFPLEGFSHYRHATAVFERFWGRRLVLVMFFESPPAKDLIHSLIEKFENISDIPHMVDFSNKLLEADEEFISRRMQDELIDLKVYTNFAVKRLCEEGLMPSIPITLNREMQSSLIFPHCISGKSFIQILVFMAYAAREISKAPPTEIRLCKINEDCRICLMMKADLQGTSCTSLEELADNFPKCRDILLLADYIAQASECCLDIISDKDTDEIGIVLCIGEFIHEDIDFKSRDQFVTFSADLEFSKKYLRALLPTLYKEEAEE